MEGSDKSQIILFDSRRSSLLVKYFLNNYDFQIVNSKYSNFKINSWKIISNYLIYLLKHFKFYKLIFNEAYFYGTIKSKKPSIVFAFYGTSLRYFSTLANALPKIRFVGLFPFQIHNHHLQNIQPSLAEYYVFGEYDKKQLIKIGQSPDLIHPVGSFYAQAYLMQKRPKLIIYDICIVSQVIHFWFDEGCSENRKKGKKIFDTLLDYLRKFCESYNQLRIIIALRPQENGIAGTLLEKKYFAEKLSGVNFIFKENEESEFSSYHTVDESMVIITHYSTIGFEALGWGKKVLFCQFYNYLPKFELPDSLVYGIKKPDYGTFKAMLEKLLLIPDKIYLEEVSKNRIEFGINDNKLIYLLKQRFNDLLNEK